MFWCGTCWESGEPSEDNVEVVRRPAAGDASCLGDGRRLTFTRLEDYPSESAAKRLVPAKRYSSVSYRRLLQEKVGGYPSPPQGSYEIDQVVEDGYAFECDSCDEPMRTVVQLVDDTNWKVGADMGTLHVHLCTSAGCKKPSAEIEFATY